MKENCERKEENFFCKKCGSKILQKTILVSFHYDTFSGCVGTGKVKSAVIPYCPNCEYEPNEIGCIHIPFLFDKSS